MSYEIKSRLADLFAGKHLHLRILPDPLKLVLIFKVESDNGSHQ